MLKLYWDQWGWTMDAIQFVWSNAAQHAYVRWSSSNIIEVGLLFLFVSYILQIRFSQLDSNTVQSSNHCPSVSFTLQQLTDISKSGRLSAAPVLVFVLVQMKNMTICEVFTGSIPIESGFKCKMIFFYFCLADYSSSHQMFLPVIAGKAQV